MACMSAASPLHDAAFDGVQFSNAVILHQPFVLFDQARVKLLIRNNLQFLLMLLLLLLLSCKADLTAAAIAAAAALPT
jgi:hypothetical protein